MITTVARSALLTSGTQEALKWTAIVLMVVDHVGSMLLEPSDALPLRVVGRLAFPLFGFLVAYNLVHRYVDPVRYVGPLLLVGVVSEPLYWWAFGGTGNIMFQLVGGVAIAATLTGSYQAGRDAKWLWALGGAVSLMFAVLFLDYGVPGLLLVPAFVWALRSLSFPAIGTVVLVLLWLNGFHPMAFVGLLVLVLVPVASFVELHVPRVGRRFFLWFYPAHLLVLGVVRAGLG